MAAEHGGWRSDELPIWILRQGFDWQRGFCERDCVFWGYRRVLQILLPVKFLPFSLPFPPSYQSLTLVEYPYHMLHLAVHVFYLFILDNG